MSFLQAAAWFSQLCPKSVNTSQPFPPPLVSTNVVWNMKCVVLCLHPNLTRNRQPCYDCLLRQAVLLAPGKSLTLVPRLHALSWDTLNEPAEFFPLNSALIVSLNSAEFFPRQSNMIVDFHLKGLRSQILAVKKPTKNCVDVQGWSAVDISPCLAK